MANKSFFLSGSGNDFFSEYRTISSKLKRRFLRRPNVAEANEQFGRLSKQLHSSEESQYEALCHLAVARCEQSMGHHTAEAESLTAASRSFFAAEELANNIQCPSLEEHLLAAVHSYGHAIRIFEECGLQSQAGGLCLEQGQVLLNLGKTCEAQSFFLRASILRSNTILDHIVAKEKVSECFIRLGNYYNALDTLTEVADLAEIHGGKEHTSVYSDIIARCEVQRVLLLLLIDPSSQNMSPRLSSILLKYAWDLDSSSPTEDVMSLVPEELFILLKSVVMAFQIDDFFTVYELEDHLVPHLNNLGRSLLRSLVNTVQDRCSEKTE